ncbi:MAG: N-acetyltransferase [Anaerolineaceae bacterium]|jgi:N-acetylglutamate synthase-like GNAT family acetyltransferase|nr:MAG: N-acetyltransferase [Anaerolineaceae bacterium]
MSQIIETSRETFTISADPARLHLNTVHDFLSRAYWAKGRPRERTEDAIKHSLVFGVYEGEKQIGFARVVTDYNIVAYLMDVFIHEYYRGRGLGKWLVQVILDHPDLKHVRRWLLATSDAHDLYRKFDFQPIEEPENWMQRLRPFPGE